MSRESLVSFEEFQAICFEIMAAGKRPSRPEVQSKLKSKLGFAGSSQVIQAYLGRFWKELPLHGAENIRTVEDVSGEFVSILDNALVAMVKEAQKVAKKTLADREAALDGREEEMRKAIEQARDTAQTADQLRMRAEGELAGVQRQLSDVQGALVDAERRIEDYTHRNNDLQATISQKDEEIIRQHRSLEAANTAALVSSETHRQEVHRLMSQIDSERQAARQETKRFGELVEKAQQEVALSRSQLAVVRAELANAETRVRDLSASLEGAERKLSAGLDAKQQAESKVATLEALVRSAEKQRDEAIARNSHQAGEIGELRQMVAQLEKAFEARKQAPPGGESQ